MTKPAKYARLKTDIDRHGENPNPDRDKAKKRINEMLEAMKEDINKNFNKDANPKEKIKLTIRHTKNPPVNQTEDIEPEVLDMKVEDL